MDLSELLKQGKSSIRHFWYDTVLGQGSDVGQSPAPVRAADGFTALYGLHNILKYDQYDEKMGLFYNDNSVSFCFEVIPQTGADEDMAARLTTLFTPLPPKYGIQWCLAATPIIEQQLQSYVELRHIAVDNSKTSPFFVELAERRVEYIRKAVGQSLWAGDNYTIKNIRLVFSVTRDGSFTDSQLIEELFDLRETLNTTLRTAALPAFAMNAEHLIDFVGPLLNPEGMYITGAFDGPQYDPGKSIKEQLTALGQHVRVTPSEMRWGKPPERGEEDKRIAMRAFGILRYPERKELWEMGGVIGSFFDDGLQYPCPFVICGGMFTLDPNAVNTKAMLKGVQTKKNATSKMAGFQRELSEQAHDWDIVLTQLNNGGNICEIYHTILLYAPIKQMGKASQLATNIWRSQNFYICPLQLLHLPALYATLPMTFTSHLRDDLRTMRLLSTKTTVNAIDMSPVVAEWRGAGKPIMMFFGRRGTPVFIDFYSNTQGNYNVFVAGVSGAGKSVVMNEIISAYRGTGARVWVIDVGRSYQNLIALQKGTFIEFTPESDLCINPFSWVGTDNELDFKSEMKFLRPIVARMASPNTPLNEFQKALITEAITQVWNVHKQDTNPTLISEYLLNNIKDEKGNPERVAYELGKQLQPFTKEGVYGSYFNGRANLSLDGDMIGLELEELKAMPELRRVVLLVLTSRIANDMYLSRDRQKICVLDEAWQLLGDDKETADFIEEGYRRARKYGGIFCLGTQGIEDAYKNEAAQAAYNNADWKILLRQDHKNLEKLIRDGVVHFAPALKKMLLSLRTSKGRFSEMLISSPNGDAVVRHIPDPFSLLVASTNSEDFNECTGLLKQGYSTMEAITLMLERRGHA